MKHFNDMSRKELYDQAEECGMFEEVVCNEIFIIPNRLKHESGF